MRIAFMGASGTGKTTLAKYLSVEYSLELNPVGSRSVANSMGFDSPYDVDKVGKRAEFQRRLAKDKFEWEATHDEFVSDRTTFDNLAYTILHGIEDVDAAAFDLALRGMRRYTHIFYCSEEEFINVANDPHRKKEGAYHRAYDIVIQGLMKKYATYAHAIPPVIPILGPDLKKRQLTCRKALDASQT